MIGIADIMAAREQIADTIRQTPLLSSEQLSLQSGNCVFLKAEHLQKTGSFKLRGATNKVKQAVYAGAASVTTASSGNHGQAVAYIANKLGIPATIVVPEDVAVCKVEAIEAYQGKVEKCGLTSAERLPRAMEIAEQQRESSCHPMTIRTSWPGKAPWDWKSWSSWMTSMRFSYQSAGAA